ncbi:MAG TPA: hypothetical protein VIV88_05810 [Gemmatimonadales bacterium]
MTRAVLKFRELAGLPQLAWIASAAPAGDDVVVYHGSAVERAPEWLVEGVWDDEFPAGGFHTSPHFFGSGIRVAEGRLYFVPSSALVNRLVYCRYRDRIVVSNSLALLLGFTGATLNPAHQYRAETYAIRHGVGRYPRSFTVTHPEIRSFYQLYDECLVLGSGDLAFESPRRVPPITSFEHYRALLGEALGRLRANYASPARRLPMTAFATISSGYDSAASAALVAPLGIATCFTSRRSNSHIPAWLSRRAAIDDGKPIADLLGLRTVYLDRRAPVDGDELYFLAPGCAPTMTVLHPLASHLQQRGGPAVLFTGFQGDEMWDVNRWERAYQDAGLVRGDTTAVMLSEIRLKAGFVNVAVPSLFARAVRDISAISLSDEMAPWRLDSAYERPIPRRILETAGVPRALFGGRKKAIVERRTYPANRALRRDFFAYLRAQGRCSGWFVYVHGAVNRCLFPFVRAWDLVRKRLFAIEPPTIPAAYVWKRFDFASMMFAWAAGALSARFAAVLRDAGAMRQPSPAGRRADSDPGRVVPWARPTVESTRVVLP